MASCLFLTRRQRDVVQRLVDGMTAREIASDLAISIYTVHEYIRSARDRVDARTTEHLVARFVSQDLHRPSRSRWTDDDDQALRSGQAWPVSDVADALGRTPAAVWQRKTRIGIVRSRKRRWTDDDDQYLRDHTTIPITTTAARLGRSYFSVATRRSALGLANTKRNKKS